MSLVNAEKTAANTCTLTIKISAEDFVAAINKVYARDKKKYRVPGFRPGKATRRMIENVYGEGVFYNDALELAFDEEYADDVKEAGIKPVDYPRDFDVKTISAAEGVELTCTVTVRPELTIGEYKGLAGYRPKVEITEDQVDTEIELLRDQNSREVDIEDRPAEDGDIVVIDFEGFVDGVAFEGGKGEDHELTIGEHRFIEGFEEQLIGHSVGEEFDIDVTFPEQYVEELAGKAAVFKIALKAIRKKELPELDDEFVKDVSEFDTLDELRADKKRELTEQGEERADRTLEESLFDSLLKVVEGEIPDVMIDRAVDESVRRFEYNLSAQGATLESYLQYIGIDEDAFRASIRPRSERDVRLDLALADIAVKEGVEATPEEIEAKYAEAAERYGMTVEKVKEIMDEDVVKDDIIRPKVIELLKSAAVISDTRPEPEKDEDDESADEEAPAEEATEQDAQTEETEQDADAE